MPAGIDACLTESLGRLRVATPQQGTSHAHGDHAHPLSLFPQT
jgi:hypothetical protein